MNLPAEEVDAILGPLVARIRRKGERGGLEKSSAEYWVARVAADGNGHNFDRGLFPIYFLNLVNLRTGQAIFQDAGIPHAYLQGQNIEVMANSDNVLRGGLTEKHVDVPELLSTVKFEGIRPVVIEGTQEESPLDAYFESPTQEFRLSRIHLGQGDTYVNSTRSIEILLIMDGAATIEGGQKHLSLRRGQSAVVFAGSTYRIEPFSKEAALFRVSLP